MLDTVEMNWQGDPVGRAEEEHFRRVVNGPVQMTMWDSPKSGEGQQPTAWTALLPKIGRVQLNSSGRLRFGRSLVKVYREVVDGVDAEKADNDEVLSAAKANAMFQDLTLILEDTFPFLDPTSLRLTRADICYQRRVEDSSKVIRALHQAVKPTRMGAAQWDNSSGEKTGYMGSGKAAVFRCYDKGKESGNRDYINVIRTEEQIRRSSVKMGQIYDLTQRIFDRERCRDVMNERFLDVGFDQEIDVDDLIRARKDTQALLILHPELMPLYKERVKPRAYHYMKALVRKRRSAAIPADLRLPEDAWEEAA